VRKPLVQYQHFNMKVPVEVEVMIDVKRVDDEIDTIDVDFDGDDIWDDLSKDARNRVMQAIESDAQQRPDRDDR
jgi:hypothetical protein